MITTPRGQFKHRIIFKNYLETSDGMGGETRTLQDYHECYAAIWPTSAKEVFAAQGVEMQITHRVRIDWPRVKTLTPDMQIYYGSRVFEILSMINVDEANVYFDFFCKEGQG